MHDIAIIGAGPVGATLALAIEGHGLDVVALETRQPGEKVRGDRSLALSHGTRLILERVPNARPVKGDMFGSVGLGLAIDAERRFGGT